MNKRRGRDSHFLNLRLILLGLGLITLVLSDSITANSRINSQSLKLALFGDSLIAGYGLENQENLASQLNLIFKNKAQFDIEFINYGVSGDTSSSALTRLNWLVSEIKPDVVFLGIGANDMLRGLPTQLVKSNLSAMIDGLQKAGKKVILMQVVSAANFGEQYQNEFNAIYPSLARQYQVDLYPFFLEDTFNQSELMLEDGVHPNAEGVKVIASQLAIFLEKWLSAQMSASPNT